jgi:uncharacterized protein with gpF-like domain
MRSNPFTLGAVLRLWDTFVERFARALFSRGRALDRADSVATPARPGHPASDRTLAQQLGITDPYMISTIDRISAMSLPAEIHSSVVQVLTEAGQQRWKRREITDALHSALTSSTGARVRDVNVDGGLADAGMSWDALARRIARTESTALFTHQTEAEIARMNYPGKRWITLGDPRVRPTHDAVNGASVRVGEAFIVGGYAMQGPGDPTAPASERSNCRCILIALGRKAARSAGIQ